MILRRFQFPLPLLLSLLSLHSTHVVFVLYGLCILVFLSFYLDHTSVSWCCNIYSLFLSRIMISGLMLCTVLSVCTCSVHSTVTFLTCCCYRRYCTRSHHCSMSDFTAISLHKLQCGSAHTHSVVSLYVLFFCQYRACWYDCLVKLFTESAPAVCFCL